MATQFHAPARGRHESISVAPEAPIRLILWQLEDRVLPAGDAFAALLPDGPGAIPIPVPAEARSLPAGALALPFLAAGSLGSAPPVVRFNNPETGAKQFPFVPYDSSFTGGVRLAVADVTGDGIPDLVTGAGPGGGSHVRVFDGQTGGQAAGPLGSFTVFEDSFVGGVHVAAADVNRDGFADVIVSAGLGGGPRIRVFSGADGVVLHDYFSANMALRFGLTVAAADVNRDGFADIIAGTGIGGAAEVAVFSGRDQSLLARYFAFEPDFTRGVSLAAADLTGDGAADIIVGAGYRGAPRVRVFDGASGGLLQDFFAFDPSSRGGVSVAATDATGDGVPEIVTGAGPGGGSLVRVFDAATLAVLTSYAAYSAPFDTTGVVVAGR
jgi:hypothetical protein